MINAICRRRVGVGRWEFEAILQYSWTVYDIQQTHQSSAVMSIGDSSTIVALPCQVEQCLHAKRIIGFKHLYQHTSAPSFEGPLSCSHVHKLCGQIDSTMFDSGHEFWSPYLEWDAFRKLQKESLKLAHADLKIWVTELIWNIPAKRAKFHSFLDTCMKEAKPKQHSSPNRPLFPKHLKELWITDGITLVILQNKDHPARKSRAQLHFSSRIFISKVLMLVLHHPCKRGSYVFCLPAAYLHAILLEIHLSSWYCFEVLLPGSFQKDSWLATIWSLH